MDDAVRGLVYLVLFVAVGGGVWIGILYLALSSAKKRAASLELENRQLKRTIDAAKNREFTQQQTDEDLLADTFADL